MRRSLSFVVVVVLAGLLMPGCGGCQRTAQKPPEEKEEQKPPERDFEWRALQARPAEGRRPQPAVKPGHWTSVVSEARANKFDERGELQLDLIQPTGGQPIELDDSRFRLITSRTAILPKRQERDLDQTLFCPLSVESAQSRTRLTGPLNSERFIETTRLSLMQPDQFFFVVLAGEPDRYRFLESLDALRIPNIDDSIRIEEPAHLVIAPGAKQLHPLPSSALQWTMIAYLLWDDRAPESLSSEEQQAMIDWLHWGGQLIISGPDSLDTLRHSFLSSSLPATSAGAREINASDLGPLNAVPWKVKDHELRPARALSGVTLDITDSEATVTLGDIERPLVVEGRVGRGRVVVTAFRLSSRELKEWAGYDRWFHGCLLRQPSRKLRLVDNEEIEIKWSRFRKEAYPMTRLSYWTRQWGPLKESLSEFRGSSDVVSSMADPVAWSDESKISTASRRVLQEAAGIVVPNSTFIARAIGAYLLLLVVNAVLCRLIGRPEFAWVTAPVLVLISTGSIVYLAQLDIGFVRARTELDIVEMYPGYDRGHTTRYIAQYSSLGTSYDVRFEDPTAVILPMGARGDTLRLQGRSTVRLVSTPSSIDEQESPVAVRLEGFEVASNATAMLHAEQMIDLSGAMTLESISPERWRLTNGTSLQLAGAMVVNEDGLVAWLGTLASGQSREFARDVEPQWPDELENSPLVSKTKPSVGLNLRDLLELAASESDDSMRLIGWIERDMGGMTISPDAAQRRVASLVVVHLKPSPFDAVEADENTRAELVGMD